MAKDVDAREDYLERVKAHREYHNALYAEREAASKPTPTPDELARASVGLSVELEPDGSGPALIPMTVLVEADESGVFAKLPEPEEYEEIDPHTGAVTRKRGRKRK